MYENNSAAKYVGPLSAGVPGELAGLHEASLTKVLKDLARGAVRSTLNYTSIHINSRAPLDLCTHKF